MLLAEWDADDRDAEEQSPEHHPDNIQQNIHDISIFSPNLAKILEPAIYALILNLLSWPLIFFRLPPFTPVLFHLADVDDIKGRGDYDTSQFQTDRELF